MLRFAVDLEAKAGARKPDECRKNT